MNVVSNTSPISYLVLIGAIDVLPRLYSEVVIPEAVYDELTHPGSPETVRHWSKSLPDWLAVHPVREKSSGVRDQLRVLDPGEQAAILLAEQIGSRLLLIDERTGRTIAKERGLAITGTIGVLGAAAQKGFVDAERAVRALRKSSFRASPDLYLWLLEKQK